MCLYKKLSQKNIFHGIKVGDNLVDISHLQFADDALIMGKWSLGNAKNLCRILRCFHMVSGLKVNFTKSKFFGVGVDNDSVLNFASFLKFQPSTLPCTYLGLPMGANMNVERNWRPIVERFQKRLSSWKATTLSYGGRLTLLKSVLGALGTYFFSLFKAPKCVLRYLEKLRQRFFWGDSSKTNKISWIAWKKVCSPKNVVVLGLALCKHRTLPCSLNGGGDSTWKSVHFGDR
ncbi:hypothetical protein Tco_0206601 [Tanacetum coccineum]